MNTARDMLLHHEQLWPRMIKTGGGVDRQNDRVLMFTAMF